jgi:hypothetical protein
VTGAQLSFFNPILNGWLQLQQSDGVRNRRAVFTGTFRDGFLRQLKFVHQTFECAGRFNRIQIFALDVFNERHFQRQLVRNLPNDRGDSLQSGALRCTPPAFARDKLKAIPYGSNDHGLNDAACLNGTRQLIQSFFAKAGARLIWTGIDQVDIDGDL